MKLLLENWREYLSEQPREVGSFAKGDQRQKEVNNYYERWKENLQDTGEKFKTKESEYNILSHDASDGIVYFLIDPNGMPKLYLFLYGENHTVDPVMKAEDARDIHTSKFYKYLMKKHGFISSGTDQSPDSRHFWEKYLELDKKVEIEVVGDQKVARLKLNEAMPYPAGYGMEAQVPVPVEKFKAALENLVATKDYEEMKKKYDEFIQEVGFKSLALQIVNEFMEELDKRPEHTDEVENLLFDLLDLIYVGENK